MKRQRREKALGINGTMKDNTAMGKIRAQQSHPSLGRQKESPAASSSSRGGGSGTSNVSAYAPTPSNAMSRAERRALADAREFGTAPPKSTPFAPNRKKTVEEESFSKLSRISARMAGRDSPSSSRPIDRSRGRERDGLNDIAYARHREPPSINVSSLINRMGMDGSKRPDKGRTGASSSSSSSRDKVTSQSSKNGNGQKRRRRSPSDSEELDSDHLDDDDDIRPSKRPVPKRRSSDRDDRPPAKGKGGGILATLGFDPYASFSRSGKGRDALVFATHSFLALFALLIGSCHSLHLGTQITASIQMKILIWIWRRMQRRFEKKKPGLRGWLGKPIEPRKKRRGRGVKRS
jgi:hypothetical protein